MRASIRQLLGATGAAVLAAALTAAGPGHARAAESATPPGPGTDSTLGRMMSPPPADSMLGHSVTPPPIQGLVDSLAALRVAGRGVDYVWVLRDVLMSPAAIDSCVDRAARMRVRGLLVQVVGRGDAWYRSALLPRAEPLSDRSDADPLAHILQRAHARGLEVHAWMNCMLVWSGRRIPRDYRHVVRSHPDWIAELRDGRRTSWISARGLKRLNIEGAYLAAARPGVKRWVASIAAEIATNYAVDGLHLDYIRQPDVEVGFDPDTRARFALAYGADPARFDRLGPARRAEMTASWRRFQRDQVTGVVRAVRDTLRTIRPGLPLSAAVVADPGRASGSTAQDWRAWVRDSLIDRAYVMCYSPDVQTVMEQLVGIEGDLGASDHVVPGIAVYNTSPMTAAIKLKGARALGYPLLALYSYDSLFTMDRGWTRLSRGLEEPSSHDEP
jgi:uncharacterized lipoprotein YddW (UPF0748 family)